MTLQSKILFTVTRPMFIGSDLHVFIVECVHIDRGG